MITNAFQDMKLSALGMGNMRLPVIDGNDAAIDEAATEAILDYSMAHLQDAGQAGEPHHLRHRPQGP